jgi:hypothetical protein
MPEDGPESASALPPTHHRFKGRKLSEILEHVAADENLNRISVHGLLDVLQDRAICVMLFIFAVPNLVITPPFTSSILAVPLMFLAAQMMLGARPWLPEVITSRSVSRLDFAAVIKGITPWLAKAEGFLRPRFAMLVYPPVERCIGGICFILAGILFLPVPLGNMLPAFAICVFALGILERDGIWIIAGAAAAVVSFALVGGVLYAFMHAVLFVVTDT